MADGRVSGLRARGGFEVSLRWSGGRPHAAEIASLLGGSCTLRSNVPLRITCGGSDPDAAGEAKASAVLKRVQLEQTGQSAHPQQAQTLYRFQRQTGHTYHIVTFH